jgi:hypothetical protein
MANDIVYIYALVDPESEEVRYVGKSVNPKERLYNHIGKCYKEQTRKANWIYSLRKNGQKPRMKILKETNQEEFPYWEEYYIKEYLKMGARLTNYDEQGIGTCSLSKIKAPKEPFQNKLKKDTTVYQFDLSGNLIRSYLSMRKAERATGLNHGNISRCCSGEKSQAGGFVFRTSPNLQIDKLVVKHMQCPKQVVEIDKNGNVIQEFNSIVQASRSTGIDASNISRMCNGLKKRKKTKGRYFRYKEKLDGF